MEGKIVGFLVTLLSVAVAENCGEIQGCKPCLKRNCTFYTFKGGKTLCSGNSIVKDVTIKINKSFSHCDFLEASLESEETSRQHEVGKGLFPF